MHLRQATLADAPVLAEIGYLAFNKEPIDGHWFPHKDRYVDDYRRAILSELTMRLVTPGEVIMVVEIDEDDCGEPKVASKARKIVAYSVFVKHGSKPEDLANWSPDTITKRILRTLVNAQGYIYSLLWPNRAVDTETYRIYYEQAHAVYQKYLDSPDSPWIDCRGLAVHPAYQRRGFGQKLLDWIGHAAWMEDVPIFGDCTEAGLPMYLKNGVEKIGKVVLPAKVVDNGPGWEPIQLNEIEVTLIRLKF